MAESGRDGSSSGLPTPAEPTLAPGVTGPPEPESFTFSPGRVRIARRDPFFSLAYPVGFFGLLAFLEDDAQIDAFLIGFLAIASAIPIAMAFAGRSRLPRTASDGWLVLDAEGLTFHCRDECTRLRWSEIGTVQTFMGDSRPVPLSLWLPTHEGTELGRSRLRRLTGSKRARPLERHDGTLIPLFFFSDKDARRIRAKANALHRASRARGG